MDGVVIRRAHEGDQTLLLDWRNDPAAVATSVSRAPVDPLTHAAWFDRTLADPTIALFIGELGGSPIGMTRFETDPRSGRTVVSINLDPGSRGKGLARPFLVASIGLARADARLPIDAVVRRDNEASLRLFEGAGFRQSRTDDEFVHFALD